MPICERDPWRLQYFDRVTCPDHVRVPTDDLDCYEWFPDFRFVYDKIWVARSQGVPCGGVGDMPSSFPVFAKPRINLRGMGLGSAVIRDAEQFGALMNTDLMWMELFAGDHVSSDYAVVKGKVMWARHATGTPWTDGMFTHWVIHATPLHEIEHRIAPWMMQHLSAYTGMINVETIGGRVIEAHLRFADQWCDLYGAAWMDALVGLYEHGSWRLRDHAQREGYSVPLFARHGMVPPHPTPDQQAVIRGLPGVSSLQITYHPTRPDEAHPMPPGGFRLGIVNCYDFNAGRAARHHLASCFSGVELMIPSY